MKKHYFRSLPYGLFLIVSVLISILSSCSKELISLDKNKKSSIEQLKYEFEESHFNINSINFNNINGTPIQNTKHSESLNIDWDNASFYKTNNKIILDIPIETNGRKIKLQSFHKTNLLTSEEKPYSTRLICEKQESGKSRFYVVTLIEKRNGKNENIKFYKNNYFSGIALVSDISGNYRASYEILQGKQKSAKIVSVDNQEELPESYSTIQTDNSPQPVAFRINHNIYMHCGKIYQEGAIIYCSSCEMFIVFAQNGTTYFMGCPNCQTIVSDNWDYCPECGIMTIPSVLVEPMRCLECSRYLADCICCDVCRKYNCICSNDIQRCSYCLNQYCNGNCITSGGGSSGGGSTGGGESGNTGSDENSGEEPRIHTICATCGGCILHGNDEGYHPCTCEEYAHDHIECPLCNRCVKDENDKCHTKSSYHSYTCLTCDCWNEINETHYATREGRARAQLEYLKVRGGREFAEDMEELLNSFREISTPMVAVYPIYDLIETEFLKLKGQYMIAISTTFADTGILIADIVFLKTDIQDVFLLFQSLFKRKIGYELSLSAWKGRKIDGYYEPLGKGSSARLPKSRKDAINLEEKLMIKEIKANPNMPEKRLLYPDEPDKIKDTRWHWTDGWRKYAYHKKLSNGKGIEIHYNGRLDENNVIIEIDDIKIKLQ